MESARELQRLPLPDSGHLNLVILLSLLETSERGYAFHTERMPITHRSGFHVWFPQLPKDVPLVTIDDFENYVARLGDFARYARDHIALMRRGIEKGLVLPRVVLEGVEDSIVPHIVDDPTDSLLYEPFGTFPASIPEPEHDRLRALGRDAISRSVVVGFREFLEFMTKEYLPRARVSIGASELPNGDEFYSHRVRHFTTLDVSPEEIHKTGLDEVARIRKEMEAVMRTTDFEGSFESFLDFLRTDDRFYAQSGEELLKEVAWILKKMDGELPKLFKRLPRTPYGVEPIPDYIAPRTTTAYYRRPLADGTRAGMYAVNLYDLRSRPLYELEALSLHEAVPGHHLQIALQQELEGLPEFRRFAIFTAFVEGVGALCGASWSRGRIL